MLVTQILGSKAGKSVVSIKPEASISEAAKMLSEHRIGSLVVSSDGVKPVGILSERDIVRELGKHGVKCMEDTVAAMMTTELKTCVRSDTADSVLAMMTEGRFRHMPVVENEALIGLISLGDVVKARLSEVSMEKDALEHMIMGH
jgi:CBS domain-containing protein